MATRKPPKKKAGAKGKAPAKAKKAAKKPAAKKKAAARPAPKKAAAAKAKKPAPKKAAAPKAKKPAKAAAYAAPKAKPGGAARLKQAAVEAAKAKAKAAADKAAAKAKAKAAVRDSYGAGGDVRMTTTLLQTVEIPAPPETVYNAYLDEGQHAKITGGAAEIDARAGGKMSAADGYVTGRFSELVDGQKIVQTWRSSEWPDGYEDSRLELTLAANGAGTRLTMVHEGVPTALAKGLEQGWIDNYWEPMRKYFSGQEPDAEVEAAADDDLDVDDEDGDDDLEAMDDDTTTDEFDDLGAAGGDVEDEIPMPETKAKKAGRKPSAAVDVDPDEISEGFGEDDGEGGGDDDD